MSPTQSRMARAGLRLTERQLAFKAGVSLRQLRAFEIGKNVDPSVIRTLQATLINMGVTFFAQVDDSYGEGVHLK